MYIGKAILTVKSGLVTKRYIWLRRTFVLSLQDVECVVDKARVEGDNYN